MRASASSRGQRTYRISSASAADELTFIVLACCVGGYGVTAMPVNVWFVVVPWLVFGAALAGLIVWLRGWPRTPIRASLRIDHMFEYSHDPGTAGDLGVYTDPVPPASSVAARHRDDQLGSVRVRYRESGPRWPRASNLPGSPLHGSLVCPAPQADRRDRTPQAGLPLTARAPRVR